MKQTGLYLSTTNILLEILKPLHAPQSTFHRLSFLKKLSTFPSSLHGVFWWFWYRGISEDQDTDQDTEST